MNIIYTAIVGSKMHGLTTPDSDEDIRFITLTPVRDIISPFNNDGVTVETSSDKDVESWELRHFCKHLCQGNPTMYEVINTDYYWSDWDDDAERIRSMMPLAFDAKKIMFAHIGYAEAQLSRYLRKANADFNALGSFTKISDIWQENQYRRIPKSIVAGYRVLAQAEQLLTTGTFEPRIDKYSPELYDRLMNIKTMNHDNITRFFIDSHMSALEDGIQKLKQTYEALDEEVKNKKPQLDRIVDILCDFYHV